MDDVYRAVDGHVGCASHAHGDPVAMSSSIQPAGDSRMCTNSVEILWFQTQRRTRSLIGRRERRPLRAVYIVEGANWFVVDLSEVRPRLFPDREINMKELAAALNARWY